jgi:hypothetical protein
MFEVKTMLFETAKTESSTALNIYQQVSNIDAKTTEN